MKNLIYTSVAVLLIFNTATAQKAIRNLTSWDTAILRKRAEHFYKHNSQARYIDIFNPATPAEVFPAKKMSSMELGTCSNYCPISKDGSLICELTAEDHCPMNGYWHSHIQQPDQGELKDSVFAGLSFSVIK